MNDPVTTVLFFICGLMIICILAVVIDTIAGRNEKDIQWPESVYDWEQNGDF